MSGTFMTADQHLAAVENFRKRIAELEAENERLLVLATKWCDKDHHDWQEILKMGEKI